VAYRTIPDHLLSEARLSRRTGHTGAVTLIQRIAVGPRGQAGKEGDSGGLQAGSTRLAG